MYRKKLAFLVTVLFICISCARAEIKNPEDAMRLAKTPQILSDDLSLDDLALALQKNIERLRQTKDASLSFGPKVVSKDYYLKSLEYLSDQIYSGISRSDFINIIKDGFDFYEVYGKDDWGEVFITSYFHPVISGSKERTPKHSQALYAVPEDLLTVHLNKFVEEFDEFLPVKDKILNNKSRLKIFRGRLSSPYIKGGSSNIVPYYSREDIDSKQKLSNRNLELAWVDAIDAFFLHVQGSGTVRFEDGEELTLGYVSQNGHPYVAIGNFLPPEIPKEKISMQVLERHLRQLTYTEMRKILYKNPSYIFFRKLDSRAITTFGTEVVDGRTIATDRRFFPKGTLAYLEFPSPVFTDSSSIEPSKWVETSRFVLDQDTGGAILGPHRVDLYWGGGKEAARHAGVMKNPGKLYYLVPKKQLLEERSKN